MSTEVWLQAAKAEEQRLFDEIAKTTLYKRLQAVRAVIAVYEETAAPPETSGQHPQAVPSARNGQASRHGFKTANAFTDSAASGADASSRSSQ
jgi:hypothetical protein